MGVFRSRIFPVAAVKRRPYAFRLDFVCAFERRPAVGVSRVLYVGKELHVRGLADMDGHPVVSAVRRQVTERTWNFQPRFRGASPDMNLGLICPDDALPDAIMILYSERMRGRIGSYRLRCEK